MSDNKLFHLFIRGIILIGYTLLMFKLMLTGDIQKFIAPKMMPYLYFALIVFLILGVFQIIKSGSKSENHHNCDCGHEHTYKQPWIKSIIIYSMFIVPILTGFLFSDHVLSSSVAQKRGVAFLPTASAEQKATEQQASEIRLKAYLENPEEYMKNLEEKYDVDLQDNSFEEIEIQEGSAEEYDENLEPEITVIGPTEEFYDSIEKTLLNKDTIVVTDEDYVSLMSLLDSRPQKFLGKKIEMIGFVYREDGIGQNQMVIARFGMTCCTADASIYGLLSEGKDLKNLKDDTWVKVTGVLETTTYNDFEIPLLQISSLEKIEVPTNPYVYENFGEFLQP